MTVTTNAGAVAAEMRAAGAQVARAVETTTRRYGLLLQSRVRANMSGRSGVFYFPDDGSTPPGEIGPRAQTGDLRRSVALVHVITGDSISSTAGSNEPQTSRLEHGFVGVDAIGREYDQPPYPAWRPALHDLALPYRDAVAQSTIKAMRG